MRKEIVSEIGDWPLRMTDNRLDASGSKIRLASRQRPGTGSFGQSGVTH